MAVWDWESIKNEYATGNMSYRDLSNKYGMAYSLICNRGSKDKWAEAREQYRSKKRAKTLFLCFYASSKDLQSVHSFIVGFAS